MNPKFHLCNHKGWRASQIEQTQQPTEVEPVSSMLHAVIIFSFITFAFAALRRMDRQGGKLLKTVSNKPQ